MILNKNRDVSSVPLVPAIAMWTVMKNYVLAVISVVKCTDQKGCPQQYELIFELLMHDYSYIAWIERPSRRGSS